MLHGHIDHVISWLPWSASEFSSSHMWSLSQANVSLLHLTSERACHTFAASHLHLLLSALVLSLRIAFPPSTCNLLILCLWLVGPFCLPPSALIS